MNDKVHQSYGIEMEMTPKAKTAQEGIFNLSYADSSNPRIAYGIDPVLLPTP